MPEPIEELYVVIGSDISKLLKETKSGVSQAEKELKKFGDTAEKETKKAEGGFKNFLGNAKTLAVGIAAAFAGTIVAAVKKLTDKAIELDVAITNLSVSANAAAREFGTVVGTGESWRQTITELGKELRIYSEKELANASSRLIDMTKRLGLTEEQMQTLLRRTADLSAGKVDLEGGIERVTAAMRGEAESAEYLGLSLNENTVKAYAEAQGIVWKNLSDSEKAQQRYNLFLEQSNELQGRAAIFAKTRAGKEAQLSAILENQGAVIGQQLMPLREGYAQLILNLTQQTEGGASVIQNALAAIAASFVALGASAVAGVNNTITVITSLADIANKVQDAILYGTDVGDAIDADFAKINEAMNKQGEIVTSFGDTWNTAFNDIRDGWQEQAKNQEQASEEFSQYPVPDPEKVKEWSDASIKALDSYGSELLDLQDDIANKSEQLEEDHIDALGDIQDEYTDALADAESKRAEALADAEKTRTESLAELEKDTAKQRQDIIEGTRKELADLEKETNRTLKEEQANFNRDELRETEDHLNSLRMLRQRYLDDIDNAVKNRDARALVEARKRYNEEKNQQEEAFSTNQRRSREDQDLRLQQIREEESRRADEIMVAQEEELRNLSENEAEKRAEIEKSYQEQRLKAEENYQQEATRAQERRDEQLQKEQENYEKEKEQIDQQISERLEQIAKGLADQDDITDEEAKNILETFAEYFGADGEIDKLMADFANRRRAKLEIQVAFETSGDTTPASSPTQDYQTHFGNVPSFAGGGSMFANRPTLVQFGEVPEMATFTPLSKIGGRGPQRVEIDLKMSGSAPPGIRSSDRDAIAGVLLNALQEAGFDRASGGRGQ